MDGFHPMLVRCLNCSAEKMLPHPIRAEHYATPEAKPEFVNRLFDNGAKHDDAVVDWGFLRTGSHSRRD